MPRDAEPAFRILAKNRRATHEFHVLEKLECGLALKGTEVKSLRAGQCSIAESFGMIRRGELWLVGATIPEYSHGNINNHETARDRKLLLQKKQLRAWDKQVRERGITIVPLVIYFKGHLVKVEMALVKGKKLHDKREDVKSRDARRDIERETSRRR
ncbi:MAG: SsrA-binding protein SmpB [Planctomycetes bacterium]|nr:SsrA-binding protein SmpB [Planctomycetota bacterium]